MDTGLQPKIRPAFTMLELVFVLVVLGIVASIGAEILSQMYQSYLVQRAVHRASIKTELASLQIANRLTYAIPDTIIARQANAAGSPTKIFLPLDEADTSDSYPILQWIGEDIDGFTGRSAGNSAPGWSGFVDLDHSDFTQRRLSTPGSQLTNIAEPIIQNLSAPHIRDLGNAALLFGGENTYNARTVGYWTETTPNISGIFLVNGDFNNTTITLDSNQGGKRLSESYKLAWSSYAIVPIPISGSEDFDLELWYNFQPWRGVYINNPDVQKRTLIRNVSVFRFKSVGNSIRFKLCQREQILPGNGSGTHITICKEKAVVR